MSVLKYRDPDTGAFVPLPSGGGGGKNGGYYVPSVTQPTEDTMEVRYTHSDTSMPEVGSVIVALPQGEKGDTGADGYTPVKGTDYWTASDKAEVVAEAAAAIDLTSYAKKTEVPTKTSQLTNDSGYLTLATLPKYGGESE